MNKNEPRLKDIEGFMDFSSNMDPYLHYAKSFVTGTISLMR